MQPLEAQWRVLEVDVWVEHAERCDGRANGSRRQEAAVVVGANVGGAGDPDELSGAVGHAKR